VKVLFTKRATTEITAALDYEATHTPQGVANIRDRLSEITALLGDPPCMGYTTQQAMGSPLRYDPYPYLIDYRVTASAVIIRRFRHAARKPSG
jgi:toxin ParE1/3/4